MGTIQDLAQRRLENQLDHDVALLKRLHGNLKADTERYGATSEEAVHRAEEVYEQLLVVHRSRAALQRVRA